MGDPITIASQQDCFHLVALPASPSITLSTVDAGTDMPKDILGQPCTYTWKDVAYDGSFFKGSTGQMLSVTAERRKGWAEKGNAMLASGIPIPINVDHDEEHADAVRGYVKGFKNEGGRLYALHQLIGKESVELASRNFVSPGIYGSVTDSSGKVWSDVITHIALTPVPVFTNQENFERIAASHVSVKETYWDKKAPFTGARMAKDNSMSMCFAPEQYDMLCSMIPGLKSVPEEHRGSHLVGHLMGRGLGGGHMHMSNIPPQMSDREAKLAKQLLCQKVDAVAARHGFSEATKKELGDALLTLPDGKPNVLLMSAVGDDADTESPAFRVLDVLEKAEPILRGPKTGQQQRQEKILASRTSGEEIDIAQLSKEMANSIVAANGNNSAGKW